MNSVPSFLRPVSNKEKTSEKSSLTPSFLRPVKSKEAEPKEPEYDLDKEIERNIAQQTSRMGESIIGAPGDIWSFAKSLFGFEPETNLPTSKSLRELSEKASLGYTKPQSEFEEKAGEIQQDISSFLMPGSGAYSLARNIGIPVVANLAKEGAKYVSGKDKGADESKIGTMIILDLLAHRGKGGAKGFATNLFKESESLVPEGATLKSSKLQSSLNSTEKLLESGGSSPSKEKALKKISEIKGKMKDGEIEVKELIDFRKTINEIKSELGGYEVQLPKHIKKKAIANLELVKKQVIDGLNEYGSTKNPEFLKLNKAANEAYAAYESSDKMGKFIKDAVKNSVKNPGVKTLLGLGGVATNAAVLGKTGAMSAIPLLAGYESYKILHQVMKSPTLRKYYGNILKGATSGNASQVSKNALALEKELEE